MNRICNPQIYAGVKNDSHQQQQQQQQLQGQQPVNGIVIQNNEINFRKDGSPSVAQEDIAIPTVSAESFAIYEKYCNMRQSLMEPMNVDPVIMKYVNTYV